MLTSFLWVAVPDVGTFNDVAIEDPTWTAPAAEIGDQVIVFTLTVTGIGGTASDSVAITVTGTGTPAPMVTIDTANQEVAGGTVLQLAATTTDANMYAWTAIPDVGTFSNDALEDPTWTAPATTTATQVVVLTLTVTGNGSATDSVTIRVTGTALLSVMVDGVTMPLLANRFKLRDRITGALHR